MSEPRLDRSAVAVYRMGEELPNREYWLTRSVAERVAAVEELRRRYYGPDYDAAKGFPRVYRIVPRT